ncbi:MAG: DUF3084 domain-containing protein, partial [Synergistaceae bacterium]|nr:DUF3084 domain-containing protein [Synergistaceae bacterium]
NWSLLCTLMAVSAVVAWFGDYIGMKLGKKRITFLKLRPKHTSRIISVLTGVGIAMFTLFVLSIAVEPVRTALFSMNYVQKQINTLTEELQKNRSSLQGMELELFESKGTLKEKQEALQNVEKKLAVEMKNLNETKTKLADMETAMHEAKTEQASLLKDNAKLAQESKKLEESVASMKKEADKLKTSMQRLREGRIAALTGEIMAQTIAKDARFTSQQVDQVVDRLSDETCALLAYRFGRKKDDIKRPIVDDHSLANVRKQLMGGTARWMIRMSAMSNAVEGEPVMTRVDAYRTRLIYKAKEVLAEKNIKAGASRAEVEDIIFRALRELNAHAARNGVMRDPLTGNVGAFDTAELMSIIDNATECKTDKKLRIIAADDIYTEGPVRVRGTLK